MNEKLVIKRDLEGIDWQEIKSILATDNFDNGRTAGQLQRSFENSHSTCIAIQEGRIIGTARALSDSVCNAYIVDVWTYTPFRLKGIARRMIAEILNDLRGQHVYLFTDDIPDFYRALGFEERGTGMERLVGRWLDNT